jgi:DNA-directed RNA polymerase specialized sigma24 family protein
MTVPTDADLLPLVERMGQGDVAALGEFVAATGPWVYGGLLRMTRSTVATAVLFEQTYADAWRQAPLYDRFLGTPRGWLFFLAREAGVGYQGKRRVNRKPRRHEDGEGVVVPGPGQGPVAVALAGLGEDGELLQRAWVSPLPGGAQGSADRARLDTALRAFADALEDAGVLDAAAAPDDAVDVVDEA